MAKPNRPKPQQPIVKESPMTEQTQDQQNQAEAEQDATEVTEVAETQEAVQQDQPEPEAAEKQEQPEQQPEETPAQEEAVAEPEAPVAEVTPTPIAAEPEAATETELSEAQVYLNNIREKGTDAQKRMLTAIEAFCDRTRPRMPIKEGDGFKAQNDLLNHMLWLLDQEPNDFDKGWSTLLIYFLENHDFAGGRNTPAGYTALSEYRATAFREEWTDHDRLTAYTNLITVLRTTRNPKTRKHDIATVVLEKVAPDVVNGKRLENLQRFYGV